MGAHAPVRVDRAARLGLVCLLFPALLGSAACAGQLPRYRTEELTFRSGPFTLAGELRLPAGPGPHPVVVFVHGDGPNDRTGGVTYPPLMERMLRSGYATYAWDKPGTGASAGQLDGGRVIAQRAQIVIDAIDMLKARAAIDRRRIGMWGISQAGFVMPQVLARSSDVAFMIAIGCAGAPGVEQGIYLLAAQMACAGYPDGDLPTLRERIRAFTVARTYEEHVRLKAPLAATPAFRDLARFGQRVDIAPEEDWHPADLTGEYYAFDPIAVVERTRIPILAVYGERDTQVDPVQGSRAYRGALARAGNPYSRVELIPGTDHNIIQAATGCIAERDRRSRAGWSDYPAQYLDLIEEWLTTLRREGWSLPQP